MPNKQSKNRKRKRILENQRLNREGRTPNQIARKKRKRALKKKDEDRIWQRR